MTLIAYSDQTINNLNLDFSFLKEADFSWGGCFFEDYLLLIGLVANLKPRTILEIGTLSGLGTVVLAHAAALFRSDVQVTSIDTDQQDARVNLHLAPRNVQITFWEGNSNGILPQLAEEGRKFDLVFIDGAHDYEQAKMDWNNTQALTSVWALHDTTQFTGLQHLVGEIEETGQYEIFQFVSERGHRRHPDMRLEPFRTGMTFIQKLENLEQLARQVWHGHDGDFLK